MRHKIGSKLWDFYSIPYDWMVSPFLKGIRKDYIQLLLQLQPNEKEINNVLIVGAGTGEDLKLLNPKLSVTATDYSRSMINKAKKKVKNDQAIQLTVMDTHHLQFDNESFDRVLMPLVITIVQNPVQCLKEAERILKKGGRMVIFDKFLHKNQKPSVLRQALNLFSNLIATNINIDLYQFVDQTNLKIIEERPALLGGLFKIFVLEKTK